MIFEPNRIISSPKNGYEFTDADFHEIAKFADEEFGLHFPETKMPLVYSRLAKRLRILGLETFSSYLNILADPIGQPEKLELLSALTTNVTHFFREEHHFKMLRDTVLPSLIEKAKRGHKVRIWSAGCSTGMEAYSIAMTILDALPNANRLNIRILATDIDPVVVQVGKIGIYDSVDVSPLTNEQKKKYLAPIENDGEQIQMSEKTKELVSFAVLNLTERLPFSGRFDVIFCRNVTIYFTQKTQEAVWQKLSSVMADQSYLFIGHSERLSGKAADLFKSSGITTYRKTDPPEQRT
ncbi:MAG: protein-glutamate O-methyltransferase [Litoreibacter sp.]